MVDFEFFGVSLRMASTLKKDGKDTIFDTYEDDLPCLARAIVAIIDQQVDNS